MREYQAAVGIRGDCLYCPLPLQIDSYWGCAPNCAHCSYRGLNRTWGNDLRAASPEEVERKLSNGLKNKDPKTSLAAALARKTTLRLGAKSDPYQPVERALRVSRRIQQALIRLEWTYIIQTRFLDNLLPDLDVLEEARDKKLVQIMPIITPGGESDWEVFEFKRTPSVPRRLRIIERLIQKGFDIGANGEPFVPGYHTFEQFRDILQRLKAVGVTSYNTHNLHLNDWVAKRIHEIGLDIEKIWTHNQDKLWRPILQQLTVIAEEEGIVLGCPDFVNSGWRYVQMSNTCCGIQAPNPTRFNTHHWKRLIQAPVPPSRDDILQTTWEGIGDREEGEEVLRGKSKSIYTMDDIADKENHGLL